MCMGGSKGDTSAPPPSPPTTFGYKADTSNTTKPAAATIGATAAEPGTTLTSGMGTADKSKTLGG